LPSTAEENPPYAALAVAGYGGVLGSLFPLVAVFSVADISAGLHLAADSAALVNTFQNVGAIGGILATPALAFGVGRGRAMGVIGTGFVVSSALCAMAPNLLVMLFARTLHGVFGGAMPLMFMLLVMTTLMPGRGRFEGMAVFAASTSLFFGLAATVGGSLVEAFGWRSLFWAQAIMALPYPALAFRVMTREKGGVEVLTKADWPNFTLLFVGLALIVIAASEGERHFWMEAWWVPAMLLGGGVVAASAVVGMLRAEKPLLLLSVFRRATFTWGIVLSLFFRFGQMFAVYIVPSYLGRLQGYRPIDTGDVLSAMMPSTAIALVIAYLWGRRHDSRWLLTAGLASFAAAAGLCVQLTPEWAADQLRLGAAVTGFGMGFFSVAVLRFATYQVTMQDGPTVGMIFNLTRVFGIVSGLGILSHLVVEREKFHSAHLVEAIGATSPETAARLAQTTGALARFSGDADGAHVAALAALARSTGGQALTLAFSDAFLVSAIALGLGAILVWALPAVPAEQPAASRKIEPKGITA